MAQTTIQGSFLDSTLDITGLVLSGASPLVFEGASADAHETTLAFVDPTADRTITFRNTTGTIALTSDLTSYITISSTDTLTNKSIDLGTNTLTGSVAEFNTALQSESFATLGGTETLVAKTLTTPTIASTGWTNALHAHAANNSGGTLSASILGAGTVPDGRFPSTLPAASGVNLTALNGTQITSGTVPVAQLGSSGSRSSSTFLNGANAWAAAGGGAMTLITSTNVTSTTGTVDFESLSGYDTYFLQVSNAVPIADGPYAVMQVGDSSGMDIANQDYGWHLLQIRANSTTVENNAFAHTTDTSETADIKLYRRGVGNSTNEGFSCSIWIHNKPNQFTRIYGMSCATSYLNETQGCFVAAERRAAITMDRVRFKFSTNSIASGRISLYGVSHA